MQAGRENSMSHVCKHEGEDLFGKIETLLPRKSHGRRSLVGCSPWGL